MVICLERVAKMISLTTTMKAEYIQVWIRKHYLGRYTSAIAISQYLSAITNRTADSLRSDKTGLWL